MNKSLDEVGARLPRAVETEEDLAPAGVAAAGAAASTDGPPVGPVPVALRRVNAACC